MYPQRVLNVCRNFVKLVSSFKFQVSSPKFQSFKPFCVVDSRHSSGLTCTPLSLRLSLRRSLAVALLQTSREIPRDSVGNCLGQCAHVVGATAFVLLKKVVAVVAGFSTVFCFLLFFFFAFFEICHSSEFPIFLFTRLALRPASTEAQALRMPFVLIEHTCTHAPTLHYRAHGGSCGEHRRAAQVRPKKSCFEHHTLFEMFLET